MKGEREVGTSKQEEQVMGGDGRKSGVEVLWTCKHDMGSMWLKGRAYIKG